MLSRVLFKISSAENRTLRTNIYRQSSTLIIPSAVRYYDNSEKGFCLHNTSNAYMLDSKHVEAH